jgi:hypothetical protein
MKNAVFWDVAPYRYCVNRQSPARVGSSLVDFSILKMEVYVLPKRRFTRDIHGDTSQKTEFFKIVHSSQFFSEIHSTPRSNSSKYYRPVHIHVNSSLVMAAIYISFITEKWGRMKVVATHSCFRQKSITFLVTVVEFETYLNLQCTSQCFFRKTRERSYG